MSESKNSTEAVQGAFDTTVNAKVSAFVSLGLADQLTHDSLNAYARVFDKYGSTEVNKIDQKGLEVLNQQFTQKNKEFKLEHETEQQKKDAAKISSKVKAGLDNFKEGANLVSQGAKKAATTVSKGVDKTAKKLVGYVEGKQKEKEEATAAKMAAKEQEAKDAAEAKEAAEAEAAAQSKAAAEAQAERDAKKSAQSNAAAEATAAARATRVVWLNKSTHKYGVTVDKKGAEQKPNILLKEGEFITFKGFTEADGSVISSALIRRFEGNADPENMWFTPWVKKGDIGDWGVELFSKCLPNLFQRSLGQKERTIDWFTVEKSQPPSRAPPPPELLPPPNTNQKTQIRSDSQSLLQQSTTSEDIDPLSAAAEERDVVDKATAARNKAGQLELAKTQGPRASSSSSSASSSSSSPRILVRSKKVLRQNTDLQRSRVVLNDHAAVADDLTRILGDDDDGSDITDTVIWYISESQNDFKVFVKKNVLGTITLKFEIWDFLGPLTKLIKENHTAIEFSKTTSGASNGGLRIVITVPYSDYRDFKNKILGKNKNWTLGLTYKSSSVEKQISLPGTWTAEKPSVDSISASAAAPTAASKNSRPLFSDDPGAYLGGGKRRRSIKKNRRSIRRTTIRRRQYKNKNKNNRRYKK
jgi:hypothetical protein